MNPKELFFQMLRIRKIEEAIASHYLEDKMRCPVRLSIGQEAVAVGVCQALNLEDLIIGSAHLHAYYLAKGGSLKAMIAELHGKKTGCSMGRGGSMHLIDLSIGMIGSTPIPGNTIPIATGLALASQMKKDLKITVSYFETQATEEGVFAESLNFARVKNLPILFLCENHLPPHSNAWAISSENRLKIVESYGILAKHINGNDVEQIYSLTSHALKHIRSGKGPAYIECDIHSISLDFKQMKKEPLADHCPISHSRNKLFPHKLATHSAFDTMKTKIEEEILQAFSFAKKSPYPEFDLDHESPYAEN